MKFTTVSLLTFPLAIFAGSCNPTECFCQLWVGGIVLQDNIPAGAGSIQRDMRIQNGTGYCSVVLDRGQGCCDQYTQTTVPTGSGCPQVFGTLKCGETIPCTTCNASTTVPSTTVPSTTTTTVIDTTTATVSSTTTTTTTTTSLQPSPSSYDPAFCNPPVAITGGNSQLIWTPICGYSYYGQSGYSWTYWTYGSAIECLQACDADGPCVMMSYDAQHTVNNCYVILDQSWTNVNFPPMYADYNQNSAYVQCGGKNCYNG